MLVAALALLAAVTGFCTGCEAYKLGCLLTRPAVRLLPAAAARAHDLAVRHRRPGGRRARRHDRHGRRLADDADADPRSSASTRRRRSAPTSSTARSSSRSAPCATASSATCTRASRSGCSPARRRCRSSASSSRARSPTRRPSTMGKIVGVSLIAGGLGFFAKTFIRRTPVEDDVRDHAAGEGDRDPDRRDLRLHRRAHLRRLGHVLRAGAAAPLPAVGDAHGRHRPAPCGAAPLGRRRRVTCSTATSTCTRSAGSSSARSRACCSARTSRSGFPSTPCGRLRLRARPLRHQARLVPARDDDHRGRGRRRRHSCSSSGSGSSSRGSAAAGASGGSPPPDAGVRFRGRAPRRLDRDRACPARGDSGCLCADGAREARALADLRHADRQPGLLAGRRRRSRP